MSNLIKYPFVDLRGKQTKVIGYEKEEEKFVPLDNKKKVLMKTLDEVEREKEEERRGRKGSRRGSGGGKDKCGSDDSRGRRAGG